MYDTRLAVQLMLAGHRAFPVSFQLLMIQTTTLTECPFNAERQIPNHMKLLQIHVLQQKYKSPKVLACCLVVLKKKKGTSIIWAGIFHLCSSSLQTINAEYLLNPVSQMYDLGATSGLLLVCE